MHVDEFIFNCCVSSMITDDTPESSSESAMNVFSIDENKIRDANGIIFAEAITCYKCTFCGKMFAAMEVVLTHYQSNHRCSVIPLLKGMSMISSPIKKKSKPSDNLYQYKPRKGKTLKTAYNSNKSKSFNYQLKPNQTYNQSTNNSNSKSGLKADPKEDQLKLINEVTGNKLNLGYNKNGQRSKRKLVCRYTDCKKKFKYYSNLLSHHKEHVRLSSFKCDWSSCQFTCSDAAGLEFHKRTHSGDNPYMCSWPGCVQSFADVMAKDQHLQSEHIGDKALQCDYPGCTETFLLASDRDRHKGIHIGKKITAPVKVIKKSSLTVYISSDDEFSEDNDVDEDEESEDEINIEDENDIEIVTNFSCSQFSDELKSEPLDLSKNSDSYEKNTRKTRQENKTENKIKAKPKLKEEKSIKSNDKLINKKVFRCDYPGCRKTFTNSDDLKNHESESHKTLANKNRSRYERKCKGNLYYKI